MADTYTTETIQRRPEYIERLEKALLSGIFGSETDGDLAGGLLQDPTLFQVAPYKLAGQQGRDPETGAITGLGPETFAHSTVVRCQTMMAFQTLCSVMVITLTTAGGSAESGIDALKSGIGQIEEAKDILFPAQTAVESGGRGMYDPSDMCLRLHVSIHN